MKLLHCTFVFVFGATAFCSAASAQTTTCDTMGSTVTCQTYGNQFSQPFAASQVDQLPDYGALAQQGSERGMQMRHEILVRRAGEMASRGDCDGARRALLQASEFELAERVERACTPARQ